MIDILNSRFCSRPAKIVFLYEKLSWEQNYYCGVWIDLLSLLVPECDMFILFKSGSYLFTWVQYIAFYSLQAYFYKIKLLYFSVMCLSSLWGSFAIDDLNG